MTSTKCHLCSDEVLIDDRHLVCAQCASRADALLRQELMAPRYDDLIARLKLAADGLMERQAVLIREAIAVLATFRCNKCSHVFAATYGTKGCQLPICAGDREDAEGRR